MTIGSRRFVNLVAENIKRGVFSVHRLNVSEHLFYPSTAEAEAAAKVVSRLEALPPPATSFQSAPASRRKGQLFALMSPRGSESRIIWSSPMEQTLLYDVESHSNYAMPRLGYKGCDPITISVARPDAPPEEDDLYVMSAGTNCPGFQVLRLGRPSNSKVNLFPNLPEAWHLESLPHPPLPEGTLICSHALLHGGRTICITAAPYGTSGTYLFDTVDREWSQAPDGWDLPFSSGAEHVPELKLWLGLCSSNRNLCASSDLSAAVDQGKLPTLKHKWEILETPEEWLATKVSLINLGGGRFCIFKLVHDVPDKSGFDDYSARGNMGKRLALLTGVEIISSSPPGGEEEEEEEGLIRMVAHKSLSYIFDKERINWVL